MISCYVSDEDLNQQFWVHKITFLLDFWVHKIAFLPVFWVHNLSIKKIVLLLR